MVAAVMGTLQPAMCTGRGVVVGLVAVTLHIVGVAYRCLVPRSVGSMPAAERVDDGAGGRLLCALFWYIVIVL